MSMGVGDSSDLIHGGDTGLRVFWLSRTDFEKRLLVVVGALSLVVVSLIVAVGVVAAQNAHPAKSSRSGIMQDLLLHPLTPTRQHTLTHPLPHTVTPTATHQLTSSVTLNPTPTRQPTPATQQLTSSVTLNPTPTRQPTPATHQLTSSVTLNPTPTRPPTRTPTSINPRVDVIVKYLRGPGAA